MGSKARGVEIVGDRPHGTVVKGLFARSWFFCLTRDHEIMVKYMQMKAKTDSVARLSSKADYTIFSYGGKSIRFAAPYSLRRYLRVTKWHDGYMEVEADYGAGAEEDFIDLRPVLRNLMIDPKRFLKSVKKVEVSYA